MNNAKLASLIAVTSMLSAIACAPIDNEIASRQSSVAGAGGGVDDTGVGGNAQGGAGGSPTTTVGGSTNPTPIEFGGMGGAILGCDDYNDITKADHAVEIVVKSNRATPLYIGNALTDDGRHPMMDLYDAAGNRLSYDIDRSLSCTCEGVVAHGYRGCMVGAYMPKPMRRIDGNTTATLTWDGLLGVSREIRPPCLFDAETQTTCTQVAPAAAGTYKVEVLASAGYECWTNGEPGPCDCVDTNSCSPYEYIQGKGEVVRASVEFDLVSSRTVTVTFTE